MANKDIKKEPKIKKHFFKDFKLELKKVIWPTPKQLFNNTIAVITIVIISAIIVGIFNICFKTITTQGLNNLQRALQKDDNTIATEEITTSDNSIQTDDASSDEIVEVVE